MKNWTKIQSFDRMHQAELRKSILDQNNISSIIINERDSLFLIGEIELLVKNEDEAKARALIDEFNGLTKVNSFVNEKPIQILQAILADNNIDAYIKRKSDNRFILENFELYVDNSNLNLVLPYLTGEKLVGWKKVETCHRVSQTKFRVDMLDEKNIDCIVIKKKNSEYHVEQIDIYTKTKEETEAKKTLKTLAGWIKIEKYPTINDIELHEDLLKQHGIRALMVFENDKYLLYVEAHNEELAIEMINSHRKWIVLRTFNNAIEARYYKDLLEENDLNAIVINQKDNSFLIGTIALYVDEKDSEPAENILKESKKFDE